MQGASVPHRPMLLGTAAGVQLDLGILQRTEAVHIAIAAERLSLDDLRLAYRQSHLLDATLLRKDTV